MLMHIKQMTLIVTIVKKSITITVAGADSATKLKKINKKVVLKLCLIC